MESFFYFQYAEPFCVSGVNNEALMRVSSFFLYPQSVVPKPYLLYFYALLNIYDGPETKGDRKYTQVKRVQIQRLMVLFVLDAVKMIKKLLFCIKVYNLLSSYQFSVNIFSQNFPQVNFQENSLK